MIERETERACSVCGKALTRTNMLYCSITCRRIGFTERQKERRRKRKELRPEIPDKMCKICGTLFQVTSPNKIYCSLACQAIRPRTKYKKLNKDEGCRRCLKCDKKFNSTSINNRLCLACNRENEILCMGSEIDIWLNEERR